MDTFFTWEYLLTFAGCVLATGLITQGLKGVLKGVPAQIISYVIALCIMVVGQLATGEMSGWDVAALDFINAMVVSLSANGGYDAIKGLLPGNGEKAGD